jgi:hypothetical protein
MRIASAEAKRPTLVPSTLSVDLGVRLLPRRRGVVSQNVCASSGDRARTFVSLRILRYLRNIAAAP